MSNLGQFIFCYAKKTSFILSLFLFMSLSPSFSDALLAVALIPTITFLVLLIVISLSLCCILKMRKKAKVHSDTVAMVPQTQIPRDTWQYIAGPPPPTYTEACVQDSNSMASENDPSNRDLSVNLSTVDTEVEEESIQMSSA